MNKSIPYRWKVIANGEPGTLSSESELWKFYLAGNGVINYAPFPPELLTPRSASTINIVDGEIGDVLLSTNVFTLPCPGALFFFDIPFRFLGVVCNVCLFCLLLLLFV